MFLGEPARTLPLGLLDAGGFGQLLGGFEQARRNGLLFQFGRVNRREAAGQVQDRRARHRQKARHEGSAQQYAGNDRDPSYEGNARRPFA